MTRQEEPTAAESSTLSLLRFVVTERPELAESIRQLMQMIAGGLRKLRDVVTAAEEAVAPAAAVVLGVAERQAVERPLLMGQRAAMSLPMNFSKGRRVPQLNSSFPVWEEGPLVVQTVQQCARVGSPPERPPI
jgi:hypothetical protein